MVWTFEKILATVASVCTIFQFLSGTLVCRKCIANGTTGDTSGLPFVMCFTSCSLWLKYGLLIGDSFVLFVNICGILLQFSYVVVFTLYNRNKSVILKQFAGALLFLALVYLYSIIDADKALVTARIGFLSCSLTIMFFASPLIMLARVIKVKSAESLPFPLIMSSLIVCCEWFAYGCILEDRFIQIPNFLGCILSVFQLSLFFIYPGKKSDEVRLI